MRRALTAVCGSALVTTLAVTGCGASNAGSNTDAATLLAATSDKTAAAQNAKIDLGMTIEAPQGEVKLTGSGAADLAHHNYRISINAPQGGSGTINEVAIGPNIWLRVPYAALTQTRGKPWVSVSTGSSAADSYNQDPAEYLKALKDINGKTRRLGTATLHGVKTTHYRVQLSLADSAKLTGATTASVKSMQAKLGNGDVPEDVYLDARGMTRRIEMQFNTPATRTSPALKMHITMDYYDFGNADLSGIAAPPAAETIASSETTLFG
jgi:hypothetical protein